MRRLHTETYSQFITRHAKASAIREIDAELAQKAIDAAARAERRAAIQPQLDILSKEADKAFFSGTFADQQAVGAKIDALLASVA
jgi:hypothetical protein